MSLELALNAKADVDELNDLKGILATKADMQLLTDLQVSGPELGVHR
jgi:hypothetical protein